ncbi:MAG: NERD domain-containing protein [Candidatus Marinimicrobia bacterium]|nr:NERD domain-containing protein [Candidatus Neomarinimicrobiota bacterium]
MRMNPLILLSLTIIILLVWKTNWFRGFFGEIQVRFLLALLPNKKYTKINNIILPSGNGSTEIDHIILSLNGIFVIETKNRSGWIYGSKNSANWTQTFENGRKFQFQNPLRQNYKHTETVIDLLNISEENVHSLVAFSGKAKFKTKLPANVLTYKQIPSYIKSFHQKVFTQDQVEEFFNKLEEKRHRGIFAKIQHIWSLRY